MTSSTLKLIAIGNSQGIRLSKALLRRYHFDKEIRVIETTKGILLQPMEAGKRTWKETFQEAAKENQVEVLSWEGTLADGLEPETFEGWGK